MKHSFWKGDRVREKNSGTLGTVVDKPSEWTTRPVGMCFVKWDGQDKASPWTFDSLEEA